MVSLACQRLVVFLCSLIGQVWQTPARHLFNLFLNVLRVVVEGHIVVWIGAQDQRHVNLDGL